MAFPFIPLGMAIFTGYMTFREFMGFGGSDQRSGSRRTEDTAKDILNKVIVYVVIGFAVLLVVLLLTRKK